MFFRIERPVGDLIKIDKYLPLSADKMKDYPDKFVEINDTDGEKIKKALEEGREVIIKNGKWEIKDYKRKYSISAKDRRKYAILQKAEEYYKSRVNKGSLLDYLYYIDINNELNDRGYFITDSNKEEKYLEILETEDDHLIDLLEEFLILKDQLSALKTARKTFLNVIERLREVSENDTEELDKIEQLIQ